MLSSWSYDGGKVQLREYAESTNHTQFYIRNNEWRMEDFKVSGPKGYCRVTVGLL